MGTIRAIRVNAVTSTSALPMPMTPAASSATPYDGSTPITASGAPQRTIATPSQRVIARLPISSVHSRLPARAPMPTAPWSTPTLASLRSSRSRATTTTKTVKAPRIAACRTTNPITTPTPAFEATAETPSRTSARRRRRPVTGARVRS